MRNDCVFNGEQLMMEELSDLVKIRVALWFKAYSRDCLLLNVTVQRSLGAVQVLISPESTVGDLIAAVLRQYAKEGRRLILPSTDPSGFDLHYSQFSLESLDREEKLAALGSRNFFLCPKKYAPDAESGGCVTTASCSKEAEKANRIGLPWLKF
ncbi:hypothetical protein TEA_016273 [Camellia sinensis var. sinensis]|uniref:DUF7054 domain-containing protein n=1 Tax=Camellia sinensis var. sinensis TaxID=542762 RepID=A0A4S4EWR2_CAMSN|nr:hypothetical protein TEA_016273 [Camellia sinensis var. sinensis]